MERDAERRCREREREREEKGTETEGERYLHTDTPLVLYIYIYVYAYVCLCFCVCVYIYVPRGAELNPIGCSSRVNDRAPFLSPFENTMKIGASSLASCPPPKKT